MTDRKHALLSASSAARWLVCTAAPRFEENFPDTSSEYAAEGTLAHSVAELYARNRFYPMTTRKFNAELKKLKTDPLYDDEMLKTAETYVDYLTEKALSYERTPHAAFEVRVDFSAYVKEGFGTCDCVMIGGDTLHITDYKRTDVPVSAIDNPQMGLRARRITAMLVFGDSVKKVSIGICQPGYTRSRKDILPVEDLIKWRNSKPIAEAAFDGKGSSSPVSLPVLPHGRVAERADYYTAWACSATPSQMENRRTADASAALKTWLSDLENYAAEALLKGDLIPGWKLVAGRSNRAFRDEAAAFQMILDAGYDKEKLYQPKTLAELEKVVGKKDFAELMGDMVYKPPGKPTLAPEDDKRPAYNSAESDFKEVIDGDSN